MNSNTTNENNVEQPSTNPDIDWLELFRKVFASRKLILIACGIGAIVGIIIASGIPKEYTASIFIVPENSREVPLRA